jgi:hypothetical protein
VFSFNDYVIFTQILIKIFALAYHQQYVSELMSGTYTKSNWKWIPKYADTYIRKIISNCCLSVKLMQSSNFLFASNR